MRDHRGTSREVGSEDMRKRLLSTVRSFEGRVAILQLVLSLLGSFASAMLIEQRMVRLFVVVICSMSAYGAASKLSSLLLEDPEDKRS